MSPDLSLTGIISVPSGPGVLPRTYFVRRLIRTSRTGVVRMQLKSKTFRNISSRIRVDTSYLTILSRATGTNLISQDYIPAGKPVPDPISGQDSEENSSRHAVQCRPPAAAPHATGIFCERDLLQPSDNVVPDPINLSQQSNYLLAHPQCRICSSQHLVSRRISFFLTKILSRNRTTGLPDPDDHSSSAGKYCEENIAAPLKQHRTLQYTDLWLPVYSSPDDKDSEEHSQAPAPGISRTQNTISDHCAGLFSFTSFPTILYSQLHPYLTYHYFN